MMHASFPEETRLLQTAFATMGGISGAYVLGDALKGLQWHVFVARSAAAQQQPVSRTQTQCKDDACRSHIAITSESVWPLLVCMFLLCAA